MTMSVIAVRGCLHCGHELPAKGKTGPAKTYCDSRCNRRARSAREYIPHSPPAHVRRPYRAKVDRTGQRFASLIVLEQLSNDRAVCRCDCGNEKQIYMRNLVSGLTVNCADRANHPDPRFKGDDVTYDGAHNRVKGERGSASGYPCALCGGPAEQWAYRHSDPDQKVGTSDKGNGLGLTYSSTPAHYWPVCRSCHTHWDVVRRKMLGNGLSLFHAALYLALDKQNGVTT
jgi:hypothetical protein